MTDRPGPADLEYVARMTRMIEVYEAEHGVITEEEIAAAQAKARAGKGNSQPIGRPESSEL